VAGHYTRARALFIVLGLRALHLLSPEEEVLFRRKCTTAPSFPMMEEGGRDDYCDYFHSHPLLFLLIRQARPSRASSHT